MYFKGSQVGISQLGQIENKCVSGNRSEILGRVGTHIYFSNYFSGQNVILCSLIGKMPFKFQKILGFVSKLRYGQVTLNTGIFSNSADPNEIQLLPEYTFRPP